MTAPKVYLAARYSRREELCAYRDQLQRMGYVVTSRWLLGEHQISDDGLNALGKTGEATVEDDANQTEDAVAMRSRFAGEDWADLMAADYCVSFTEAPRSSASRGGRHVEFGAALAAGKRCLVVGPRENVFHCLPRVVVHPDWISALVDLGRDLAAGYRDAPRTMVSDNAQATLELPCPCDHDLHHGLCLAHGELRPGCDCATRAARAAAGR